MAVWGDVISSPSSHIFSRIASAKLNKNLASSCFGRHGLHSSIGSIGVTSCIGGSTVNCKIDTEVKEGFGFNGFIDCIGSGPKRRIDDSLDVVTLGNLCVDIVLNVPNLPPESVQEKQDYLKRLMESVPSEAAWEAGGNSNFAIAAARLGLRCVALGHVGPEKFGQFLLKALEGEGVEIVEIAENDCPLGEHGYDGSTLLCWVLVDPHCKHGFISHFDFNKNPVYSKINILPARAKARIKRSKALFINGFIFDELSAAVVLSAIECAHSSRCSVFFDPGPRGKAFATGSLEQKSFLQTMTGLSNVLLLTADEAEILTGISDPIRSAEILLTRSKCTEWVIIKLGALGCLMATSGGTHYVPGFKVDVVDTVGCGDSFAAAAVLGYTHNLNITTTLMLANAVGAATATGSGAGRNVATLEKVSLLLSNPNLKECINDWKFSGKHEGVLAVSVKAVADAALSALNRKPQICEHRI